MTLRSGRPRGARRLLLALLVLAAALAARARELLGDMDDELDQLVQSQLDLQEPPAGKERKERKEPKEKDSAAEEEARCEKKGKAFDPAKGKCVKAKEEEEEDSAEEEEEEGDPAEDEEDPAEDEEAAECGGTAVCSEGMRDARLELLQADALLDHWVPDCLLEFGLLRRGVSTLGAFLSRSDADGAGDEVRPWARPGSAPGTAAVGTLTGRNPSQDEDAAAGEVSPCQAGIEAAFGPNATCICDSPELLDAFADTSKALLGVDPSAVLEEFYGEYDCEWPPLDRYLDAHGH